jgi:hypothetical protein
MATDDVTVRLPLLVTSHALATLLGLHHHISIETKDVITSKSSDEQHRTVSLTNILLPVLQVLLALLALAFVVLAEPQYVQVYQSGSRPRLSGGFYRRPNDPTVIVVNNRPRVRPVRPGFLVGPAVLRPPTVITV